MSITIADLYLPIGKQKLSQIIKGGANHLEQAISGLAVPQIASLLLLQSLVERKNQQFNHPESDLAKLIYAFNARLKKEELSSFLTEVASVLSLKSIEAGWNLLPSLGMALLDEESIIGRSYLTAEGEWDYTFKQRYNEGCRKSLVKVDNDGAGKIHFLTSEQTRIYQEIGAQSDDHMHIQGYAGTGKTSLIRHLISMLDKNGVRVLLLAERQTQISALQSGISEMEHVFAKTFSALAYEVIPPDLTNRRHRNIRKMDFSRTAMSDEEIIEHFGVVSSSQISARSLVEASRKTLFKFCHSGDDNIQPDHIPNGLLLDETTKQVVLYYATKLWEETLNPTSKDFKPPVRGYHQIKWAALNGWQIPRKYTHILIDECHNLPKSMLQILDCSPQAIISLGDEYQNLQGKSQQRSNNVRYREVTHSVRSGCLVENIVNPIIAIHPGKTKVPFHGNQLNHLEITYYNKPQVPDKPTAILASSMWGLFEWAQHVAYKNLNLTLLTNAEDLKMFVSDCIDLYLHGTRPRHGALFRFKDWNAVERYYHNNQSFQKVDRLLRRNYQHADWERTSAKFTRNSPQSYLLGRVEDVRNHEFESVMIIPEVVSPLSQPLHEDIGAIGSTIYVAVTRAKQRLIVPEELRSRIEEISAG